MAEVAYGSLPFGEMGMDDHVGEAGFIFQRDKNHPFCRAGALTENRQTGHTDLSAGVVFF